MTHRFLSIFNHFQWFSGIFSCFNGFPFEILGQQKLTPKASTTEMTKITENVKTAGKPLKITEIELSVV